MQELPISIIPYISSCFHDYFVIWKNISINHELFLELIHGAVLTVFDSLCHHVWGLRLLYPGDLVTFLDQHVCVSTVCYFWKTWVSLFSLTKKYQSNSATHFFTFHLHQVLHRNWKYYFLKLCNYNTVNQHIFATLFLYLLLIIHVSFKATYICNPAFFFENN